MQLTTVTDYEEVKCRGNPALYTRDKDGNRVPTGCDGTYTDDYGSWQCCSYCGGTGKQIVVKSVSTKVTG